MNENARVQFHEIIMIIVLMIMVLLIIIYIYFYFGPPGRINKTCPTPTKNILCQPFKLEKQMQSEHDALIAQGYKILLYQDLPEIYKLRSDGKAEIIEQSNLECFDKELITQSWLTNELWWRSIK